MKFIISRRSDREYPAGVWWCTSCQGYFDDELPLTLLRFWNEKKLDQWLETSHPVTAHVPAFWTEWLKLVGL